MNMNKEELGMIKKLRMIHLWRKYVMDAYNGGHFEMTENPATATHIHPGLSFLHLDREYQPDMRKLMTFFTEVRNMVLYTYRGPNNANLLDFPHVTKDRLLFISCAEIQINRKMYDRYIPKWPLKVTTSLCHIGKSSLSLSTDLYLHGGDSPLATFKSSFVTVGKVDRKTMPLPDWLKEKYGDKALSQVPCRVESLKKPSETFHFEATILWSDADLNNHTNYATYVFYATNGLRAALRSQSSKFEDHHKTPRQTTNNEHSLRALRGFCREIMDNGLKSVRVSYRKESLEGDRLDFYLWQEEGDHLGVKAVVEKEGKILCHLHLDYFGTQTQSHL